MTNLTGATPRGLKQPKEPRGPLKAIPKVSAKTQARKASADGKAGALHMAWVAQQPCCICGAWPVHVHHCICGRYGQRKASDLHTIPLCYDHHQGRNGIHTSKREWEAKHGPDTKYLPIVAGMLAGE